MTTPQQSLGRVSMVCKREEITMNALNQEEREHYMNSKLSVKDYSSIMETIKTKVKSRSHAP